MSFTKQGLITHDVIEQNDVAKIYKNDIVVNNNIFLNSHFDSKISISDWDTSKNGNYCASNWGGYNSDVSNPSKVYHAHLELYNNEWVYNYTKNSDNTWLGVSQNLTDKITAGNTYCFSADYLRKEGSNYSYGGFYTKANSSATDNSFVATFTINDIATAEIGKWIRYSTVITIPSTAYLADGVSFYIYGNKADGTILMRQPKLELASKATLWCPNKDDILYTKLKWKEQIIALPIECNQIYEL